MAFKLKYNSIGDLQKGSKMKRVKVAKNKESYNISSSNDYPSHGVDTKYTANKLTKYGEDHLTKETKKNYIMHVPKSDWKSEKSKLVVGGKETAKKQRNKNIKSNIVGGTAKTIIGLGLSHMYNIR
tara:strand:+ start:401 stop:778 length:378 start_codon:yes stop_codon:yes gene_type:complete